MAACSSTSPSKTTSTTNPITSPANRSAQAALKASAVKTSAGGGVTLALKFGITNPGTGGKAPATAIAGTLSGNYNMSSNEGTLTVVVTQPATISQLIGGPLHLSILDGNAYFIPPSTLASTLGVSAGQYAELPLSTLSTLLQLGSLGSSIVNPSGLFALFDTPAMAVKDLGAASVNGIATAQYSTSVNLKAAIADGGSAQSIYKALKATSPKESTATSNVWIGSTNQRLRQISLSIPDLPSGLVWNKGATLSITLSITAFGVTATVTPPPASQVKQVTL